MKTLSAVALARLLADTALANCKPHSMRLAIIPIKNVEDMLR